MFSFHFFITFVMSKQDGYTISRYNTHIIIMKKLFVIFCLLCSISVYSSDINGGLFFRSHQQPGTIRTRLVLNGGKPIKKAAFCTGSGGNLIEAALNQGADAYITSEVKHDQWLLAKQRGISVFDCGHFHTENIGMIRLCKMLAADFSNIEFVMSEVNKDPVKYVL